MLELTTTGQIDAAALAADNYFLSLLAAGAKQGILTDADLARLQSESFALLAAQTATYTGGESSSVRTETAQALLDSVFYTLGIVLKGFPTPDAALQALKSRSLAALAACGDAAEKAALLKSRVRSRGDLLDVLHDAEWSSDDLAVLLAALPPAAVAALCAVCPADGLSDDPQDIALAAALADYRNALAPSEVAQLDAAVRALRRGAETEV